MLFRKRLMALLMIVALLGGYSLSHPQPSEAQKPSLGCLEYEDSIGVRGVWNLDTNQVSGPALNSEKQNMPPAQFWRAPDGKNDAYLYQSDQQFQVLFMKATTGFNPRAVETTVHPDVDARNFVWSSDSKWFAFAWRSIDDKWNLSIRSGNGAIAKTVPLTPKAPDDQVALQGWSGNDKFLAVSFGGKIDTNTQSAPNWYEIGIYSLPDLKLVRKFNQTDGVAARYPMIENMRTDDNVLWARSGAWLAFFSGTAGKSLTLNLYSPETNVVQNFSVSAIPTKRYKLLWSPSGTLAAFLTQPADNDDPDKLPWRLDVFGVDSKVYLNIADKISNVAQIAGGPTYAAVATWSLDGRALIYARQMTPFKKQRGDIYYWTAADQQTTKAASEAVLDLQASLPNRYLTVKTIANEAKQILVFDSQNLTRYTLPSFVSDGAEQVIPSWASASGWLILYEGAVPTWTLNTESGVRRQVFDPEVKSVTWAVASADNRAIAQLVEINKKSVLRLYVAGNRRDLTVDWLPKTNAAPSGFAISANSQLFALIPYAIFQEDGKLVKRLPEFKGKFNNFALTTCGVAK